MNILIVGINYRPETTGIAPYTTDLAEYYASVGHEVTVVTGFPHYPAWRLDPRERRFRAVEHHEGVRIVRRRHYVPRTQSALRRALYEGTFGLHGLASRTNRPDVVFGIVPSLSGGLLARYFAARAKVPYALIFQDLMGPAARQSGIGGGARVAGITARMERWAARRASIVATASDSFRPYLEELGVETSRLLSFPNWSHLGEPTTERDVTRARLGWPPDCTVVLHAGNMGLKQGLGQVIRAARRSDALGLDVVFVLMGDGSQREALQAEGESVKCLRFMPFQPQDELANILTAADVLLVSERSTVIDMSLPSKLTSYFAAGRPIVAAVPPDGSTAREIERSGAGVIVPTGNPDVLNRVVGRIRADQSWAGALGAAGRRYAESALGLADAHARMEHLLRETVRPSPASSRTADEGARSFEVLGVSINAAPFDAVLQRVLQAPATGERLALHFATVHTLVEAQGSTQLRDALGKGTVQPDGMPLVWLGRAAGRGVERVCGPDFMPALIEHGIPAGRRHFFYGGAPGVPEALEQRLSERYPGLRVVGRLAPPFRPLTDAEESAIVKEINDAAPDYVWVGLGTPKQDLWLASHREKLDASALMAVGAAFDLFAGRRRRAPRWMQRTGTEWIYRLAMEPRRLAGRYTRLNVRFIRLLLRDIVARRHRDQR